MPLFQLGEYDQCEIKCQSVLTELCFMVVYFSNMVVFWWYSLNKVGNIGIIVFWLICEKLWYNMPKQVLLEAGPRMREGHLLKRNKNKTVLLRDRKRRTARTPQTPKVSKMFVQFFVQNFVHFLSICCPKFCPTFLSKFGGGGGYPQRMIVLGDGWSLRNMNSSRAGRNWGFI